MWCPSCWLKTNEKWWYIHQDRTYAKNDFENISAQTYYFDSEGYMATGWRKINNKWYFFNGSGYMLKKQWVGNYYLQTDGTMATNKWIEKYYVDSSGYCIN